MKINKERLWNREQEIGEIGRDERGGISRFAWTTEYRKAALLLIDWIKSQALNAKNIAGFCVLSFSQFPFCFFVHIQQPSNFAISSLKRSSAVP